MLDHDEVDAGLDRAIALLEAGRYHEALRLSGRLLAQAADRAEVWLLLAACHAHVGEAASAETAAERAIGLDPEACLGYVVLAYSGLVGGHPDRAVDPARAAVRHDPYEPTAHSLLALALAGSADEARRAEAVEAADRACALEPDDAHNHYVRGVVAHLQGAPARARRSYERALGLDPAHAEARYNVGVLDAGDGEPLRAVSGFADVLRADPTHQDARAAIDVLAWVGVGAGFALNLALTRFTVKAIDFALSARLGVDLLVALAVPGLIAVLLWRAPAVVRSCVSRKLRRDPRFLVSVAAVLACSAGLAASGFLRPHLAAWAVGAIMCIAIVGLLTLMLGALAGHPGDIDSTDAGLVAWYPVWTSYGLILAEVWLMRAVTTLPGSARVFAGLACAAVPALLIAAAGPAVGRRARPRSGATGSRDLSLLAARVGVLICASGFVLATFSRAPLALAALLADLGVVAVMAVQAWYVYRRAARAGVR
ncbi:MAG TPA: tetratricopeptide repeat protein [Streptosporangiales bacterium]